MTNSNPRLAVLCCFLVSHPICRAQEKPPQERSVGIDYELSLLKRVPAFKSEIDVFRLLANRSIRDELGFSVENLMKYRRILAADGAARLEVRDKFLGTGRPVAGGLFRAALAQIEQDMLDSTKALLSPKQVARLDQLPHYVEIAYVGLGVALADGKLGKEIGIVENQRTHLREKCKAISDEAEGKVREQMASAHQKILELIPIDRRQNAEKLLGRFFEFISAAAIGLAQSNKDIRDESAWHLSRGGKEESYSETEIAKSRGVVHAHDYSTFALMFGLLHHDCIRRELGITREQFAAYSRIESDGLARVGQASMKAVKEKKATIQDVSKSLAVFAKAELEQYRLDCESAIQEILTPAESQRLMQLAHYAEIASRGYAVSITQGRLSAAIGILDSEKQELYIRISIIEKDRDMSARSIRAQAQEVALRELSSEQAKRLETTLGPYFRYEDSTIHAIRNLALNEAEGQDSASTALKPNKTP